jgi:putative endonuclease
MFFVYAISSTARNYIYVGLTDDFDRRLHQHNMGYNKTTKPYRPFHVLLVESYPTRIKAREREKYLKTGQGKAFLKRKLLSI